MRRLLDPFDAVSGRFTALLGVLWVAGAGATLVSMLGGTYEQGWPPGILVVGVVGVGVGVVLVLLHPRVLPRWVYAVLTLLGALAIALIVLWAGPEADAAPAMSFIYVGVFAFVALPTVAPGLIALSAALHLGALVLAGASGVVGKWVLTWTTAVVAGVLVARVIAAHRGRAADEAQLADQWREADVTKTALLHAVGHELSRPTTAVVGFVETLEAHGEQLSDDERAELVGRLAANTRRLEEMLTSLLDPRKVTSGRLVLDVEKVALDACLDAAVGVAGVDPGRVVGAGAEVVVRADRSKLTHALANLLDNAAKYGGDGPIDVEVAEDDDTVVVAVADHGPGLDDRDKARVLEPFERAVQDPDAVPGSGIGLSLVRQFARLHGGDAWLEDREGGGTRACLRLPTSPGGPPRGTGQRD